MTAWRRLAGVAGALALAAVLLAGCTQMVVDEARARDLAAAFVEAQNPPGTTMRDVRVTSVRHEPRSSGPGWLVEANGTPARAGEAASVPYYFILFVDGTTGEVMIEGQG
jgi:hypothetical protein